MEKSHTENVSGRHPYGDPQGLLSLYFLLLFSEDRTCNLILAKEYGKSEEISSICLSYVIRDSVLILSE